MCSSDLVISVPVTRPNAKHQERDHLGRLFKNYSPDFLANTFDAVGYRMLEQWKNADSLKRVGVEWVSQLYQLD